MPDIPTSSEIRIADLVTCPKCGQSNAPEERYCTSCGNHLTGTVSAQMAQAEPAKKQGFLGRIFAKK